MSERHGFTPTLLPQRMRTGELVMQLVMTGCCTWSRCNDSCCESTKPISSGMEAQDKLELRHAEGSLVPSHPAHRCSDNSAAAPSPSLLGE